MRPYLLLSLLAAAVAAQPARVRVESNVRSGPDGEVVGHVKLGEELEVRSRITTETGSWCRIKGSVSGSVPCGALLISEPPPPPPPPPPAPVRAAANPRQQALAKNAVPPAPAPGEALLIEHPTPAQIRRAFPDGGDVKATLDTTPQTMLMQTYKFSANSDVSLIVWVRPAGMALSSNDADLTTALSGAPDKLRPHPLRDGRKLRWGTVPGGLMVTGKSPGGDYEWTMVYATPESPDDVTSYVLTGATTLDRVLFGR